MSDVIRIAAVLAICAALPALAAESNRVTAIEVDGPRVVIHGSKKPDFSAFKLADPARLVVDLAGADVTGAAAPASVHKDGISGVTVAQFDEGATKVGRIVVALEADARYDVTGRGNDVVVVIGEPQAAAGSADSNLVVSLEDAREVAHPATRLLAVSVQGEGSRAKVSLATDGEVARFTLVELKNPGRLALDLHGIASSARHQNTGAGPLKGVRVAKRDGGVRVVLDASGDAMPKYQVVRTGSALVVSVGEAKVAKAAPAAKPAAPARAESRPMTAQAEETSSKLARVRAVDLRTDGGATRVVVDCDGPVQFEVKRPDATTAVLVLQDSDLPDRLERNLDAGSLRAPVTMLSSYRTRGKPGEVQIVATMRPGTTDAVEAVKGVLTWKFGGPQAVAQAQPAAAAPRAPAIANETRACVL
jgi:type IV pilus assembly protein PilQ